MANLEFEIIGQLAATAPLVQYLGVFAAVAFDGSRYHGSRDLGHVLERPPDSLRIDPGTRVQPGKRILQDLPQPGVLLRVGITDCPLEFPLSPFESPFGRGFLQPPFLSGDWSTTRGHKKSVVQLTTPIAP